jgi:hypothetical protein
MNKQTAAVQQSSKGKKPENHETVQSLWVPTDSVGLYTLVLAVFTGLLAVVAGIQGAFMLRADKTARIAANAAKESAEVARQSLSYTQRAFVFIKMDGGPVVDAANQALAGFRFFPTAENFGNTPAINWESYVGGDLFDGEIPDNFGYPAANEGGPLRSAIPPRSKINAGFGHIRKDLVDPIYRREKRFFVWGRAKYNDIFESSPTYHIEYCWEVVLAGDITNPVHVHMNFIEYPKHNRQYEVPLQQGSAALS